MEDGDDEEVGLVAKIPEEAEVVGVFRRKFPNKFIPLEMKFAEIEKVCQSKWLIVIKFVSNQVETDLVKIYFWR